MRSWPPQRPISNGLNLLQLQVMYVHAEYGLILQLMMIIIAHFHLSKATIDETTALHCQAIPQHLALSLTQTPALPLNLTCHVHAKAWLTQLADESTPQGTKRKR